MARHLLVAALAALAVSADAAGSASWNRAKGAPPAAGAKAAPPKGAAPAAPPPVKNSPAPAATGGIYWYNEVTGDVSETDPLTNYRGFTTEAGNTYWIDPDTKASVWERPAPYGWMEEPSKEHEGLSYFYNQVTKASTWDRPAVLGWKTAEKGFWFNNVTGASSWERPDAVSLTATDGEAKYWIVNGATTWEPPADFAWRAVPSTDPSHEGRPYFENWVTKETSWERPAALAWSRRSQNKTYWWNIVTGETTRTAPIHAVGIETPEGHTYYLDPKTGEATWEAPEAAAWKEGQSEDPAHAGRAYWYNTVTKASVWERPADSNVAWQKTHDEI